MDREEFERTMSTVSSITRESATSIGESFKGLIISQHIETLSKVWLTCNNETKLNYAIQICGIKYAPEFIVYMDEYMKSK